MSKSTNVQHWVDTLPSSNRSPPVSTNYSPSMRSPLRYMAREMSLQSDDGSSHCSSVESVLELRKPDPEAVLLELGFGPPRNANIASRIPNRFLQPSKLLTQIDVKKFLEQYGVPQCSEHSVPNSPAKSKPKTY